MTKIFVCPECKRDVQQFNIKNHISNCEKYLQKAHFLDKIKDCTASQNDPNKLKFLFEELSLAQEYIQIILMKKQENMESGNDLFQLDQPKILKKKITVKKHYSSQFYESPIKGSSNPNLDNQKFKTAKLHGIKVLKTNKNLVKDQINEKYEMEINSNRQFEQKQNYLIDMIDQSQQINLQIVMCPLCKNKFYSTFEIEKLDMIEECWHMVCKNCFKPYILKEYLTKDGTPKCPHQECQITLKREQIRASIGNKELQILDDKVMRKLANFNIVECIKCQSQYDFIPGNPNDAPKKDQSGKPIKQQHAILFAEQRFICPRPDCKTEQCKQCKVTPYHMGMNCSQYKKRALMLKCRYCTTPITQKNINKSNQAQIFHDICNDKDCQQTLKQACTKKLPCSHPCCGIRNQIKCLPCLKQICCQKQKGLGGQKGSDYCSVCYVEGLDAAPSIQCGCGHIFHFKCIKKRLEIKWLTPRILFQFCLCPLCKKWIDVPPENELHNIIKNLKILHDEIEKMSFERLKFEELQKDEKLTNKDSPYFNKPKQYAMAIYAYFMCFKCQKPYFGGRKNCAEVMNADQNKEGFNPKQLICPRCCDIPIENCSKHGVDFIEFKCKFCCSTAQWFCWGNTHFCQPCHKRQCDGDYISKYTKEQLPKCQGPGRCPVGGNHNGNGQQKMLGCAICRNYKQNSKNF